MRILPAAPMFRLGKKTSLHAPVRTGWVALGLTLTVAAPADDRIDLPAAIQTALLQNQWLQQAGLNVESAAFGILQAEAGFDYHWRPDGNTFLSEDGDTLNVGMSVARKLTPGTEVLLRGSTTRFDPATAAASHRTTLRLQIAQPLFRRFGPLVHREPVLRATRQEQTVRRQWEQQKADLVIDVVRVYEEVVRLDHQLKFDERFYERVDRLYRLTLARERQGRATRIDTLRVELQRGQALSRLENNRERRAARILDLTDAMGASPEASFTLSPSPLVELDPAELDSARTIAFTHRLNIAQAEQDLGDATRTTKIARRGAWPALRLVTGLERFGVEESFSGSAGLDETVWTIGLESDSAYVPRRSRAVLEQRVIDRESARRALDLVYNAVAREVDQRLLAYDRTHRELDISEHNLGLAGDRVHLAQRLFELGRSDSFSVTDAENAFLAAQQQLLVARVDASLAGYRVLHSLGTLIETPENLRPTGNGPP